MTKADGRSSIWPRLQHSASPVTACRLIVNADDFGLSHSINEAVVRAHREGILTTASLMVRGEEFEEAVEMARACPDLGVGLHLTLICGKSVLEPGVLSGLVDGGGNFSNDPVRTGWRYFFNRGLRDQLLSEIDAQFEKFRAAGLRLDHVNGHLNMHMHPTVFRLLMENAHRWGIRRFRLTRDPFWFNARLAGGRWGYRITHALVFNWLSFRCKRQLRDSGIHHTRVVYGLLRNGRMDESYLKELLRAMAPGDSELYSHPSLEDFDREFKALVSPEIREVIESKGIELIRYGDL